MKLYTMGYEGIDIDDFVVRLSRSAIEIVIDVRELPLSRKKGFSKNSLSETLRNANIAYLHIPALGCPKNIRQQYKETADWTAYTRAFKSYLSTQRSVVDELAGIVQSKTACLICFEADANYCHRTYVARATEEAGGPPVFHLTARTVVADGRTRVVA